MADIKFDPETATVTVGQHGLVGQPGHASTTTSWPSRGADFKSELFGNGQTFTATVDKAGTVKHVCTVHPGMTGNDHGRALPGAVLGAQAEAAQEQQRLLAERAGRGRTPSSTAAP